MLSLTGLVSLLLTLLVFCLIVWLIWWAGNAIISLLPPPIAGVARVILIVLVCLACISALVGFLNGGFMLHPFFLGGRVGSAAPLTWFG